MKIKHWIALVIFIVTVIVIGVKWHNYNSLYHPKVNPNPKYFMTIKGHIAKPLLNELKLQFVATYTANNKECEVIVNPNVGTPIFMRRVISYNPEISKNQDYLIKIPLDRFLPGYCKWQAYSVRYHLLSDKHTSPRLKEFLNKIQTYSFVNQSNYTYKIDNKKYYIRLNGPIDINKLFQTVKVEITKVT